MTKVPDGYIVCPNPECRNGVIKEFKGGRYISRDCQLCDGTGQIPDPFAE